MDEQSRRTQRQAFLFDPDISLTAVRTDTCHRENGKKFCATYGGRGFLYKGRAGYLTRRTTLIAIAFLIMLALSFSSCELRPALAETFKITAYCSCSKCCGKSDGITASGHKLQKGDKVVACNWLKFGQKVEIEGLGRFEVADRGAKSLFGTFKRPLKHLDVWFPTHKEALRFGVQWKEVKIL